MATTTKTTITEETMTRMNSVHPQESKTFLSGSRTNEVSRTSLEVRFEVSHIHSTSNIGQAMDFFKQIHNPNDVDIETQNLMNSIAQLNIGIENKGLTSNELLLKMVALVQELSYEQIATMTAMLLEVLHNKSIAENKGNEDLIEKIRKDFYKRIATLPLGSKKKEVQPILPAYIPPIYYVPVLHKSTFEEWDAFLTPEMREKIMKMTPQEAIDYFQIDPMTAYNCFHINTYANNFKTKNCKWLGSTRGCLHGWFCWHSHHPMTKEWIDSNRKEFFNYVKTLLGK
jgi:hypothetical protein